MNSLIPQSINDDSMKAFDLLMQRISDIDLTPLLVYLIDEVEVSALPHLAEQFNVSGIRGWNFCSNEQEQRSLIKNAIKLHKYKGTKYALLKVFETLNMQGKVEEWFEYSGEPYHFRINMLRIFNKTITPETLDLLDQLIDEYKNVRSHLDKITIYFTTMSQTPRIAAINILREKISAYPWIPSNIQNIKDVFYALITRHYEIVSTYPMVKSLIWDQGSWDDMEWV